MTPQVDHMTGGTSVHFPRPEGDVAEMKRNINLLKGHATDLRELAKLSADQTGVTGEGPLVTRVNDREQNRTQAIKDQLTAVEGAIATLTTAASQVDAAQDAWKRDEQARAKAPDKR